jgi:hypothetical protein
MTEPRTHGNRRGRTMKKEIIFIDEETLTPEEREALSDEPAGE